MPVNYRIRPRHPGAHIFEVHCYVPEPDPAGQLFSMPTWIPGSYLVRDFARHVVKLQARSNGSTLGHEKVDKSNWLCEPCIGPIEIIYEVYANDLSVRGAYLDTLRGFFNGTSVFLRAVGLEDQPCIVEIQAPAGQRYKNWRVATAMERDEADFLGFGAYRTQDYDELIDHPVEMGVFTLGEYRAGGVPHRIVISGRHQVDIDRLCADLTQLCEHHIDFFGKPPPMEEYWFLTLAVGDGYGGLEHRASSSLMCRRDELPQPGRLEINEKYRRLLGLCSHEYFHLWNVKRIKPQAFVPYRLDKESYTRLLWVFEGITSYYQDLALVRCDLISIESYLELLGQTLTRVWRSPGRHKQSLADSSFDAWTKLYKPNENTPNAVISYYAKGALVALALDLTIRKQSDGRVSLDDVMRAMWQRYGRTGEGVPEEGFEQLAHEVTSLDLQDFFDLAVRGTQDLPMEDLLSYVGVGFHVRPTTSDTDKGGQPAKGQDADRPSLGVKTKTEQDRIKLVHVYDHSAAQEAGLSAEDEIVAMDDLRVTGSNFTDLLNTYTPGDEVRLIVFRRDELMHFKVNLKGPALDTVYLTLNKRAGSEVLQNRQHWLQLSNDHRGAG